MYPVDKAKPFALIVWIWLYIVLIGYCTSQPRKIFMETLFSCAKGLCPRLLVHERLDLFDLFLVIFLFLSACTSKREQNLSKKL